MATTINYNNNTLTTLNNGDTVTLNTNQTYMQDDIEVVDTTSISSLTVTPGASQQTFDGITIGNQIARLTKNSRTITPSLTVGNKYYFVYQYGTESQSMNGNLSQQTGTFICINPNTTVYYDNVTITPNNVTFNNDNYDVFIFTIYGTTVYDGYMPVTINGDSNLIASNIKAGVSIFGVTGTYEGSSIGGVTQDENGYIILPPNGGSGSGSSTPSATQHIVHLEFTDSTSTNLNVYYNDSLFSTIITSYTLETYNSKTVQTAALDNVIWYTRPTIVWETLYNDTTGYFQDDNATYAYCWISALSDVQIPDNSVWRITFDNVEYLCTAAYDSTNQMNVLGNFKYSQGVDNGSDAPFSFYWSQYGAWSGGADGPNVTSSHNVKIERGTVQ